MRKNYPRYTLRISRELLDKIGYIADYNGRTKNKEIEHIIKKYVNDYERMYGLIKIETEYDEWFFSKFCHNLEKTIDNIISTIYNLRVFRLLCVFFVRKTRVI